MKYIIGNWKANPSKLDDAKKLYSEIKKITKKAYSSGVVVAICPPTLYLSSLISKNDNNLILGSQDVATLNNSTETGVTTALLCKNLGVKYVIVGHSESRRRGDTNEIVASKLANIVGTGLTAILCIGEKKRDSNGLYFNEVATQIRESMADFPHNKLSKLIIAYEPVWAIGEDAEAPAEPKDFYEMAMLIRRTLTEQFDKKNAFSIPLLYGGSVDKKNAESYMNIGADGLLIGRTSLKSKDFISIIEKIQNNQSVKK